MRLSQTARSPLSVRLDKCNVEVEKEIPLISLWTGGRAAKSVAVAAGLCLGGGLHLFDVNISQRY